MIDFMLVYAVGSTAACSYAAEILQKKGIPLVDHPTPEVTHLLLDVPSFGSDGLLRGGGQLNDLLRMLPDGVTVVGGNLQHPALGAYKTMDLLKEEAYLAKNAAITAECAMQVAAQKMPFTFAGAKVLMLGWGRIGKCLAQLLKGCGSAVTVAARKASDRAMAQALGFGAVEFSRIPEILPRLRLIFNTVPELIIHKEALSRCKNCIKIDLASKPGMEDEDVIIARGLPGIYAPESSGQLIADTFLRMHREERI